MSDVSNKNLFTILAAMLILQGCGSAVSVTATAGEDPPVAGPSPDPESDDDVDQNSSGNSSDSRGNSSAGGNRRPTVEGSAPVVAVVDQEYMYTPNGHDADGDRLTYRGENIPDWLRLDRNTGRMWGTPVESDIGQYTDIRLSVSDGHETLTVEPFDIEVASVSNRQITLEWRAPGRRADGSELVNLKGFRIMRGRSKFRLHEIADLNNPGIDRFVVENLGHGEWWFALTAYDSEGIESEQSKRISIFID